MRIIAGTSGGIPIKVPRDTTRPTTDRVREAIFSSLGTLVEDATVLDLFAGSGALGLESLSRGSKSALFVDSSRHACKVIEENLAKTKLSDKASVKTMIVERAVRGFGASTRFDIIFADPPYARDEERLEAVAAFLAQENLPRLLSPDGVLILESYSRSLSPRIEGLTNYREKSYGDTRISYFHLLESETE